MKKHLINIKDLLKRGFLEIFPKTAEIFVRMFVWISSLIKAIPKSILPKARYSSAFLLGFLFLILVGCSTQRHVVTQLVEHTSIDTIYLSNIQYDSIYVYQNHISEHHLGTLPPVNSKGKYLNTPMRTDTLYIKDKSIEYRYKLLRDTIRVVQRDSIPYEVTITETKEITRPLTWYDHLTRTVFWFAIGSFLTFIIFKLRKVFKP